MQYDENGCSCGQMVIGSFIKTITSHAEFFWQNIKSPRWLCPLQLRFGALWFWAFPQTKITFEREEISDCRWDSGKYDRPADGDSSCKGFCRVIWTVKEMPRELFEVPTCLLWRGLRRHCPVYSVSSIFFNKSLFFILHGWIPSGQTSYTYCHFGHLSSLVRVWKGYGLCSKKEALHQDVRFSHFYQLSPLLTCFPAGLLLPGQHMACPSL